MELVFEKVIQSFVKRTPLVFLPCLLCSANLATTHKLYIPEMMMVKEEGDTIVAGMVPLKRNNVSKQKTPSNQTMNPERKIKSHKLKIMNHSDIFMLVMKAKTVRLISRACKWVGGNGDASRCVLCGRKGFYSIVAGNRYEVGLVFWDSMLLIISCFPLVTVMFNILFESFWETIWSQPNRCAISITYETIFYYVLSP